MATVVALVPDPDAIHEQKIMDVMDEFNQATIRGDRQMACAKWREVVGLIQARSPKQVRKMERQRGIV
jgi:hypothetical protein